MNIAYICYKNIGTFDSPVEDEESVLFDFLTNKGLHIHKVIWNEPNVDWKSYDLALLKSPWDYFEYIDDFYVWLTYLQSINLPLLNPASVVKWNSDKHYLAEIEAAGLPVIPTQYISKGSKLSIQDYFEYYNTDQVIIKPCVSGGSFHTFKVNKENVIEIENKLINLLPIMDFMIQPFIPEIQTEGEWSFLFFDGKFSHSLIKKAKSGDFRVQHYLGGAIYPTIPSPELLSEATKYVEQFADGCLYARVDGVIVNGEFKLMELELIEPFLFLFTNADAYENYYQALIKRIEIG